MMSFEMADLYEKAVNDALAAGYPRNDNIAKAEEVIKKMREKNYKIPIHEQIIFKAVLGAFYKDKDKWKVQEGVK